jgi:hypothetical protein
MTQPREIEGVLDRWFSDGPRELSDRALADALSEIDHTRQLGAHVVPWRFSEMPTPVRLLLVAALMAVSAGAALLISAGARNNESTPSPSPAQLGPGELIGTDNAGTWSADRPGSFGFPPGDYFLTIPIGGGHLFGNAADSPEIDLGSIIDEGEGLSGLSATALCSNIGHYRHELSKDTQTFKITVLFDDCRDRAALLAGDWHHDWIERQVFPETRYRVNVNGATVDVTVPTSFVSASGGYTTFSGPADPVWSAKFGTGDWAFALQSDAPDGGSAVDRCHENLGHRYMPTTIDEYLGWSQASRGLDVTEPVRLTVAGYPAVRVDLTGGSDCQSADVDSVSPTFFVQGMETREWAIDIGDRLILALVVDESPMELLTPEVMAAGEAFVQSLEITPAP